MAGKTESGTISKAVWTAGAGERVFVHTECAMYTDASRQRGRHLTGLDAGKGGNKWEISVSLPEEGGTAMAFSMGGAATEDLTPW